MKLVYFGTAEFAVPALRAVAQWTSLVVSQPDRPSGRGMKLQPSPVKRAAEELGIPVLTPEKARDPEFIQRIHEEQADALLVAAYGQILRPALLEAARQGSINLHGSILPKYRGAAPIQRAILEGETETGVTLMQMDVGMDTGDMIALATTPIGPDETAGDLTPRLADLAAGLAREWMPRIAAGDYPRTPQDNDRATHAAKIEKAEAELRPDRPAEEEYRRFRAFTPAPGAYLMTAEGPVKVTQARWVPEAEGTPGTVAALHPDVVIAFQTGGLQLLEVAPPGRKRMSGTDYVHGLRLRPGDALWLPGINSNQ